LLAPFRFYTVPYARREIEKHRSGLVKRAGIDDETFQYIMDKIFERIEVVSLGLLTTKFLFGDAAAPDNAFEST